MTLDRFRPLASRVLNPFVNASVRVGLTPNAVSVTAFALAFGAGVAFSFADTTPWLAMGGAVLVFCNGWLDLLDGALARRLNVASSTGDLLDHVLDRYADIVVLVGLAAGSDQYELGLAAVTGVLMTSYLGTQAAAVGLDRVYGGVLGRADRLALIGIGGVLYTLVPGRFYNLTVIGWLLVLFAVVGHLTAVQRFYHAIAALDG
ncbi:CDP-alcohol phosphatidyltransferase family protein [Halocatena pleomorpha]|uniref:CDP-alcohol phosphatidyltransferase family protein n=1 Tax=Halocatena pleomorpha TaxID=1785090 RepID=A0A3P3RJ16_9EURY|nr:CDP-alcohol phosphatidyltransferase family protein [Halocatena pleomorpha]RRJ33537.1 CDP-alcohol phosphatidyltransferase family protein [Halocatena pleomorpha]